MFFSAQLPVSVEVIFTETSHFNQRHFTFYPIIKDKLQQQNINYLLLLANINTSSDKTPQIDTKHQTV